MANWLKNRWQLFAIILVLIVFKLPHLFYPYYWDECWPYASAVDAVYHHGFSLLPGAIADDLSRGHPLFFHNMAALWLRLFGNAQWAAHTFALSVSVLLLIAMYEVALRLFSQQVAFLSVALLAAQELFLAQSSMLLPEVLVALLCLVSLYWYVAERYLLAGIALAMLFFTKESGLMLGFVLGVDALVGLLRRQQPLRTGLCRLAAVAIPSLLIVLFFVLQKLTKGWFIFPLHSQIVEEHSWKLYWYQFRMSVVSSLFYSNLKYLYFIVVALLSLVVTIRQKAPRYLLFLLPFVIVYYFVDDMRAGRLLPPVPFFIVFIASWFWCAYIVSRYFASRNQQRFVWLAACFVLVYAAFSAANFFIPRYMLAAMVPMFMLTAALGYYLISQSYQWLYYCCIAGLAVVMWLAVDRNGPDLIAYSGMDVQQSVVDYLEKNNHYNTHIACQYLDLVHLTDPATGFLRHKRPFRQVKWAIDDSTDVVLFNNLENDDRYTTFKTRKDFKQVFRYTKASVWCEVYERIPADTTHR
jgi:4-amino-4-deoxy-L-arabinose transferase-like glycosyltransferase